MKNDGSLAAVFLPAIRIDRSLNQIDDGVDVLHDRRGANAGVAKADAVQSAGIHDVADVIGAGDHGLAGLERRCHLNRLLLDHVSQTKITQNLPQ